jgi:transmembrane sensor
MKEPIEDMNWTLMAKYLGRELNDNEKEQLAKWTKESDMNGTELQNAEKIWELSSMKESQPFDTDKNWERMKNRIHTVPKIQEGIRKHIFISSLKIAASLLILISLTFAVYWFIGKSSYVKVVADNGKILQPIILPDGSEVFLNAGASVKYPKVFSGTVRKIDLSGEAFFNVTHNEKMPFIIQTELAQVKVLGTSFDVDACHSCDVKVSVETGTVVLSSKRGTENIKLTKGNTGVYFIRSRKLEKSATSDVNAFAWRTNEIIFDNSNLFYVCKTLENVFSKKIELDNRLKNCTLNSNFKNSDLESILGTLKVTYNIQIKKTGESYVLLGNGCQSNR